MVDESHFMSMKSYLNNAAMAIMLNQSNNQHFVVKVSHSIVIKDYHFLVLRLAISYFADISIDFHLQKALESTATAVIV